jgi:hypothetical protein
MKTLLPLPAAVLLATLVFPGPACSHLQDGMGYPRVDAPEELTSTPAETGLVVVDCTIEERTPAGIFPIGLQGGALALVGGGERLHAAPRGGLLVFDGVPAGRWRLASVRSAAWRAHESVTGRSVQDHDPRTYPLAGGGPDPDDPLVIDVETGGLHYLGRVVVSNARSRTEAEAEVRESRQGELRAWRRLANHYPDSAWRSRLETRIAELEPGG